MFFVGYARVTRPPWRICTRCLTYAAGSTRCTLCHTYPFSTGDLPTSSGGIIEGALGGRQLAYISRLPDLIVSRVREGHSRSRWSYFVVYRLLSRYFINLDQHITLRVVVEVSIGVLCRPPIVRKWQESSGMLCFWLTIVVCHILRRGRSLNFYSGLMSDLISPLRRFVIQWFWGRFRHPWGVIRHLRLDVSDLHGSPHRGQLLKDEAINVQAYRLLLLLWVAI